MRPSDFWKTSAEQEADWLGKSTTWLDMPFGAIEQLCSNLRKPSIPCKANRQKYAGGFFFVTIEVEFDDGVIWVARLCTEHRTGRALSPKIISRRIGCEVATLKLVSERTTIPVPTVYSWSDSTKNELGFPYVLSSAILGQTAEGFELPTLENRPDVIPQHKLEAFQRFCKSLAKVHLELSRITFDKLGSVYFDPKDATKYVADRKHTKTLNLMKQHRSSPENHLKAAFTVWLHRQLLISIANAEEGSSSFMFSHGDLRYANIMVDESGEIIGIIDWDLAGSVPKHNFAAQLREHVQILFPYETRCGPHYSIYHAALVEEEKTQPDHHHVQSLTVSELYASPVTQMLAFATKFIRSANCVDERWPEAYARVLWGTTDWSAALEGDAFKQWYAAIHPSLRAVSPDVSPS
ncbi:hypothetical protein BKA62DRAFT_726617 [Auriculariales sp. MPI-PUGE-AT-0066]|nr:hypothetical protein BKA62DRAFT_726617 [Auriculariales sp. MPI-PUGE-AT-0066]